MVSLTQHSYWPHIVRSSASARVNACSVHVCSRMWKREGRLCHKWVECGKECGCRCCQTLFFFSRCSWRPVIALVWMRVMCQAAWIKGHSHKGILDLPFFFFSPNVIIVMTRSLQTTTTCRRILHSCRFLGKRIHPRNFHRCAKHQTVNAWDWWPTYLQPCASSTEWETRQEGELCFLGQLDNVASSWCRLS